MMTNAVREREVSGYKRCMAAIERHGGVHEDAVGDRKFLEGLVCDN